MNEKYVKVGADHPQELYKDPSTEPRYIMLICEEEPPSVQSTESITIRKAPRSIDNRWALHIRLNDDVTDSRLIQIFATFVNDLIDSTKKTDTKCAIDIVLSRYKKWIALFKPHKNPLTKNEVQGLIGEIIVLSQILFPLYGESTAIESWMNAKKGKQDFICSDNWYEVKTVLENRSSITITSLEQLDREDEGILVIVRMSESNTTSSNCITLNSLFLLVNNSIESEIEKDRFIAILLASGYNPDPEYDKYAFELNNISKYKVTNNFPRIRRQDIKYSAIKNLTYEILVDQIDNFRL